MNPGRWQDFYLENCYHLTPYRTECRMDKQVVERAINFIDSWLLYRYERLEMPGFVVAIAHDGDVVFKRAFGYANLEQRTPMSTEHLFRIASHSKTFTATAVMQLAEKGRLSIDDAIVKHVAWLQEHRDPRMARITIRQIMSHSAGLLRDSLDLNWWQLTRPFPDLAELKKEVLNSDLILDNNKEMKYSNIGYALLGCLVETVSATPFDRYVKENIIDALGLKDTHPDYAHEIRSKLSTGYSRPDTEKHRLPITEQISTKAMAPAGGVCTNVTDMCKYFAAHFVGSGKLLSDESKKEMQRTQWRLSDSKDGEEYGLGIEIDFADKRRLFGHGGGFPGHRTKTMCDPKDNLIVVVLANSIDGDAKAIGKGIFSIIDHFEKSAQLTDQASLDELKQYQGRFMELWGDLDIIENGRHLIAIDPNTWSPFGKDQYIQLLERIDDCTWRIAETGNFFSLGELVKYNFDKEGSVESLRYAGKELLPEAQYVSKLAKMKKEKSLVQVPG
jgi:D-alanyl-D-alanine carboxypeptidase